MHFPLRPFAASAVMNACHGSLISYRFVWEVQGGVGAVERDGGAVVGSGGVCLDIEGAEVSGPAVFLDMGGPFVAAGVIGDAEVAAGGGRGAAAVGVVLGGGAVAAIFPAVV